MGSNKHDTSAPTQTASEDPAGVSAAFDEAKAIQASANAVSPADAWLASLLHAGPIKVSEIAAAAQAAGMSMRTVERAKRRLGIKADRSGKGWCWSLPQDRHDEEATPEAVKVDEQQVRPPEAAPPGPAFTIGQFMMGAGAAKLSTEFAQPRLVPLWSAMGRRRT
jgi:hypothetical protein